MANATVPGPASATRGPCAFEILREQPLAELRSPHAMAYGAIAPDRPGESFFALVSEPAYAPRRELIEKLANLRPDNTVSPVGWGAVDLAGHPAKSFATIFERPRGGRVASAPGEVITPFTTDEILHEALPSLAAALRSFAAARVTHRAIRPSNLFYHGMGKQLVLGECVSAPAAMDQPLLFETIESAMALPYARGAGAIADDLYALGATLVYLLFGRDPAEMFEPKQLVSAKIDRGSHAAILGLERVPPELSELLRGLLADDLRERWTMQDLEGWLQGRRARPRQLIAVGLSATRPFDFAGAGYFTARALAHAFSTNPVEAARTIRGQEFEVWLRRSLADDKRSAAMASIRLDAGEARLGASNDVRLAARASIALDPTAPIRYGEFSAALDGIGTALVAAFHGVGSPQLIGEVLSARLPQSWIGAQTSMRPELTALSAAKPFDVLRRFAEDPRPGFGLERVLYELNPQLHCLAPAILPDHVVKAVDLLDALEHAAARGTGGDALVERHVAAFAAAHSPQVGTDCFGLLGGSPRQRALGTLAFLARLQTAYGPGAVPAIGKSLAPQLTALVDIFHSRTRRARLKGEIARLAAAGSLSELHWLLTASGEQALDVSQYAAAQREHAACEQALVKLRQEQHLRPQRADDIGGRAGVMTASLIAASIVIAAVMKVF